MHVQNVTSNCDPTFRHTFWTWKVKPHFELDLSSQIYLKPLLLSERWDDMQNETSQTVCKAVLQIDLTLSNLFYPDS